MNDLKTSEKKYNDLVSHPLQSFEWGEFRKKTGVTIIRTETFQFSIHTIPYTPFTIGYFPKGEMPTKETIEKLRKIGKENKCIFIQLEPNVVGAPNITTQMKNFGLVHAAHPLFTKFTFMLDMAQSEEDLLKNMHQKTRYNIRVAEKHGVSIIEDNSDEAFEEYLKLTQETTKRQGFFAHTEKYHRLMWETLRSNQDKLSNNTLTAHLFLAKYKNETLAAWIVFVFKDTLYYPYGSSSSKFRETMASNLMMWEVIKFGKKLGLKNFDMWGALSSEPSKNDPWYGFHRFKEGYGPKLVEFVGSYDLVLSRPLYEVYKLADKARWTLLKLSRR
jgi:lipid II:glycine glycyltransferase (peptidoglycan interpeptide bridge formation enzyme)